MEEEHQEARQVHAIFSTFLNAERHGQGLTGVEIVGRLAPGRNNEARVPDFAAQDADAAILVKGYLAPIVFVFPTTARRRILHDRPHG
jgi:hypothetical protein